MTVTFFCRSVFRYVEKYHIGFFSFHFAQSTNPVYSKLDISFSFILILNSFSQQMFRFSFSNTFNILVTRPVLDGMLFVYKGKDKKSLQTWILKKNNMKPKKNWSIFSALYQTHSGDFVVLLKLRLENPCILWCWNAMFVSHNVY